MAPDHDELRLLYEQAVHEQRAMLDRWNLANFAANTAIQSAEARIDVLEAAIREHRDARGDDRCHEDDTTLYQILPEGYTPPARDTAVTLENCKRFIACRQNPATIYVSPEREIERLRAVIAEVAALADEWSRNHWQFAMLREFGDLLKRRIAHDRGEGTTTV